MCVCGFIFSVELVNLPKNIFEVGDLVLFWTCLQHDLLNLHGRYFGVEMYDMATRIQLDGGGR